MKDLKTPVQLSLEVSLRDDATFANYYLSADNTVALKALKEFSANRGDQNLILWGGKHCGLTHLLQACNHAANQSGIGVQYIPVNDVKNYSPDDVFDALDCLDLVCLDGVDEICGNEQWEQSLFHFYNRLRDRGGRLLIACHTSPILLPIGLLDLKSRVCGSVTYHIQALDDTDKAKALQMRAKLRGMDMSEEVTSFILSRASRDTAELFQLLNRLDKTSLQQQRKITIPFVKHLLSTQDPL